MRCVYCAARIINYQNRHNQNEVFRVKALATIPIHGVSPLNPRVVKMRSILSVPVLILILAAVLRPSWFRHGVSSFEASARVVSDTHEPAGIFAKPPIDASELAFDIPTVSTYRSQVLSRGTAHEHRISSELRNFSNRMEVLMENAMTSEPFAIAFFEHLSVCALAANDTLTQARVICAANATRLGRAYPNSLSAKARQLRGQLPVEIQEYLESMGF
jgi:hypothetical protein